MRIAEIIVRDKETICKMVLVTVYLVVYNNAVSDFTVATGPHKKVQILDFMTFLIGGALFPT
jgi:hypothetical protein